MKTSSYKKGDEPDRIELRHRLDNHGLQPTPAADPIIAGLVVISAMLAVFVALGYALAGLIFH